jgi:DNA-binding MarR family transcriptional regulator/GNAT superfamily N-acetyltransferase
MIRRMRNSLVDTVRRFNRLYTKKIGLLPEGHLGSPYTLAEVRVLYEVAHRERATASRIAQDLHLDLGYMSRIVHRFAKNQILQRKRSALDAREVVLSLTPKGKAIFARLNDRASAEVASILAELSREKRSRMAEAMQTIGGVLGDEAASSHRARLRAPKPGDLGWVIQRHGEIYFAEYGWNADFETLVAKIVAKFADKSDPRRERCWIAERGGSRAGCVFLVKKTKDVAQLRLLLVEPSARGAGIGRQLVDECARFARRAGYKRIVLWTNSVLEPARRIYAQAGYRVIDTEPHHSFGKDLVAETWQLDL